MSTQRELKFRVWDGERMHNVTGQGLHLIFWNDPTRIAWGLYDASDAKVTDSQYGIASVMQYTFLKDKNGKEIYEGDVVQYKDLAYSFDSEDEISIDVVTWGDDEAAWMLVCAFSGERQTLWDGLSLKKSEVIGNIHENPELTPA